jgi:hypothetical protein
MSHLEKNLPLFCWCPETLWETEFTSDNGFIKSAEEISDSIAFRLLQLMLAAVSQINSENQEQKEEQKKQADW